MIALHGLKDNATDHIWRGARERRRPQLPKRHVARARAGWAIGYLAAGALAVLW